MHVCLPIFQAVSGFARQSQNNTIEEVAMGAMHGDFSIRAQGDDK